MASNRFYLLFREFKSVLKAKGSGSPISSMAYGSNARSYHCTARVLKEPTKPSNHYEIFPVALPAGPPPRGPFDIDVRALRKEFLQLQAKAHPDMHGGNDKRRAEGLSMLINEAYKTLQDPLRRAQYLLTLRGIDVAEDETAKVEDPELLMEVLEMREAIEGAEEESELEPLKMANDENILKSVRTLADAFGSDDINLAKAEAVRLRYWVNIKESLDAWERGKPVVLVH